MDIIILGLGAVAAALSSYVALRPVKRPVPVRVERRRR